MTQVNCYIKYSPDTIDVSGSVLDRVDIWKRATDGIGRFKVTLKNTNNQWVGQFLADDPIQILIAGAIFLEGYIDKGFPYSVSEKSAYQQFYELTGRDYGQDLANKLVDKTGKWMYKPQPADDIVDDMLSKASSEITFTSPGTAPQIPYTDSGDEYLIEAFRKIAEKINYDLYVDIYKALHFFAIGTLSSGITLECVAGATDNNILRLEHVEFDAYELRNYIVAKGKEIDDSWTEGNTDGFTGATGNNVSNEFVLVKRGAGSIKCARGTADHCELNLTFPRYDYDYLPFELFGCETLELWLYLNIPGAPYYWLDRVKIYVELEDTNGKKIRWYMHTDALIEAITDLWKQYSVPIGTECEIKKYKGSYSKNQWRYSADPGETAFNWQVKRITIHAKDTTDKPVENMYLDGMKIPLAIISYKQDGTSEGLYKARQYPVSARDVKTQKELDGYAQSQVEKRKDPIKGLKIWAIGTAGISGNLDKWIPGYKVTVNSPGDGINNVAYRILDVHLIVSETPIMDGHNFIAEVDLVLPDTKVSGQRISHIKDPNVALLRALNDRIRFMEKEEELKYDYFPPLSPYAADQIKVGEFASLSDTIVAWSRHWEENVFQDIDAKCSIVDDATAVNGKVLKIPSDQGNIVFPFKSPNIIGEISGEIYAIFALKVSNKTSTDTLCELHLIASGESRGQYPLKPNDFPFANEWHHFAVRGTLKANDANVYITIYAFVGGLTDLYVDFIGILPANVPLGYADVTVTPHTGTDTSPHSGTDTDSHSGTDTDSHAGSSAAISFMPGNLILNQESYPSEVAVGSGSNVIIGSGNCSSIGDAIDLALIEVWVQRGASGGADNVRIYVYAEQEIEYRAIYINANLTLYALKTLTPNNLNNKAITIYARTGSGTVYLQARIRVRQFTKHTHSMVNPNDHVVIQPSDHSVTQPSNHSVTQPADHGTTGEGHEH